MTKAEREYLSRVADLGCIACLQLGIPDTPAEIHHVRHGQGAGQRSKHIGGTLGLCPAHHRTGGYGTALHAGQKAFEKKFGSEQTLLDIVNRRLE